MYDTASAPTAFDYEGKDLEAMSNAANYHQWIAESFAPYLGSRVCEVGAGAGNFSSFLLAHSVDQLLAIEPSKQMYPLLAQKFAHEPRVIAKQALLQDIYKDSGVFDSVVFVNVLEHIKDEAEELACAHAMLKPGGHLLIFVPALQGLYSAFDAQVGHYRRYRKPQLIELVERSGFEVVEARYFDMLGILPWFVTLKLFKGSLNPRNTTLYDRVAVPLVRRFETLVPVPVGKNILLIARKAA